MEEKHVVGQIMITQEEIFLRAKEIGNQISKDYAGETVLVVGILKGAVLWLADVIKNITIDTEIDFMAVSSYGASTKSSGVVRILKDLDRPIEDMHVIVVEDIIDSGITLNYLKGLLIARGPKSIKFCTLLDKPTGRRTEFKADYVGFEVEDKFIVGYGLDYNQRYRNLPYISFMD
jgi:hypoxanthine phosphoribosyltransferase